MRAPDTAGEATCSVDGLPIAILLPPPGSRRRKDELYRQLRDAMLAARLAPGAQLPPSRVMAAALGLARNTVVAVYDMLAADGYVEGRVGGGTFVARVLAPPAPTRSSAPDADPRLTPAFRGLAPFVLDPPPALDMRVGSADISLFPIPVWRQLSYRALRDLERGSPAMPSPAGSTRLREAIAAHIAHIRAIACTPDDCIVTSGAQQAFDLIARVLIEPAKTVVAVENPGYPALHKLLAMAGAIVRPVPVDAQGMIVSAIPRDARVVFVTPSNHVPYGHTLSLARRMELLAFADREGAAIVEDDYDGEFRFADRPIDALRTLDRSESVFYVGTFTKCTFSALRLGYAIVPAWARPALLAAKQLTDWHAPLPAQDTLAAFIREGHLVRHTRRIRRAYGERCRMLVDALRNEIEPLQLTSRVSGLHLALFCPAGLAGETWRTAAAREGVGTESLADYFLPGTPSNQGLVLGFGRLPTAAVPEAARALGRAFRSLA